MKTRLIIIWLAAACLPSSIHADQAANWVRSAFGIPLKVDHSTDRPGPSGPPKVLTPWAGDIGSFQPRLPPREALQRERALAVGKAFPDFVLHDLAGQPLARIFQTLLSSEATACPNIRPAVAGALASGLMAKPHGGFALSPHALHGFGSQPPKRRQTPAKNPSRV